jgi:hypothetical protein
LADWANHLSVVPSHGFKGKASFFSNRETLGERLNFCYRILQRLCNIQSIYSEVGAEISLLASNRPLTAFEILLALFFSKNRVSRFGQYRAELLMISFRTAELTSNASKDSWMQTFSLPSKSFSKAGKKLL